MAVWAPPEAVTHPTKAGLPVMVYFHGGCKPGSAPQRKVRTNRQLLWSLPSSNPLIHESFAWTALVCGDAFSVQSADGYVGSIAARADVISISVNYRLGVAGYLAVDALAEVTCAPFICLTCRLTAPSSTPSQG